MSAHAQREPSTVGIGSFQRYADNDLEALWAYFDRMRARGDVVWDADADAWILCSHAAYREFARQDDRLWEKGLLHANPTPVDVETLLEMQGGRRQVTMLQGERHLRAHKWWLHTFSSPDALVYWRSEAIRPVATALIDRFSDRGGAELCSEFVDKLFVRICAAFAGLPWDDDAWVDELHELFIRQSEIMGRYCAGVDSEASGEAMTLSRAWDAMVMPYCLEERPAEAGDIISRLRREGHTIIEDWSALDTMRLVKGVFFATIDSNGKALENSLAVVLNEPQLVQRLVAEPAMTDRFVEECLRLVPPRYQLARHAKQDLELAGVKIAKGERVIAFAGAANRDPTRFPCPHELRFDRDSPKAHLTFHAGPRACGGAAFARASLVDSLNMLLERLPELRLDPEREPPSPYGFLTPGHRPLHVRFGPSRGV